MGPADGTGLATTFASTTPDQILRDINGQLTGIFAGMLGVEITDTLLQKQADDLGIEYARSVSTEKLKELVDAKLAECLDGCGGGGRPFGTDGPCFQSFKASRILSFALPKPF
ncbi:hypothetical protein NKJ17_29810 [Mesorhizobium sp. M0208]